MAKKYRYDFAYLGTRPEILFSLKKYFRDGIQKIEKKGTVIVGKGSFLGLKLPEWNAYLTLAPHTHIAFDFSPKTLKKVLLKRGSLRWTSLSTQKTKENKCSEKDMSVE